MRKFNVYQCLFNSLEETCDFGLSQRLLRLVHKNILDFESPFPLFPGKSGLRVVKTANSIRIMRRSGLKNPDYPKNFIKKNVRNQTFQPFCPD